MPLRDHFRSPLADRRSWDGLHGQWPAMIVIGLNPLVIYLAQEVVDFDRPAAFVSGGVAGRMPLWAPVIAAVATLAIKWLVLLWMHRRRIYLRV